MDMAFSVVNHLQEQMTHVQTAKPIIISTSDHLTEGGESLPFFSFCSPHI